MFAEKYNAYREILVKDALLVIQGGVSEDSFTGGLKMLAESIQSIYEARCSKITSLELAVSGDQQQWWNDCTAVSIPTWMATAARGGL